MGGMGGCDKIGEEVTHEVAINDILTRQEV